MVRSPVQTALLVAGVFAIGVVAGVLGFPSAGVVIFTSGVGVGLIFKDRNARRDLAARERGGPDLDHYPLQVAAERVAVGSSFQFRLLPPTRAVWAPGLLCIGPGEARFVPSRDKHADRAWAGPVDVADVKASKAGMASVRLRGREGEAQFVLTQPPANVAEAIPAWIAATPGRGGAIPQ